MIHQISYHADNPFAAYMFHTVTVDGKEALILSDHNGYIMPSEVAKDVINKLTLAYETNEINDLILNDNAVRYFAQHGI